MKKLLFILAACACVAAGDRAQRHQCVILTADLVYDYDTKTSYYRIWNVSTSDGAQQPQSVNLAQEIANDLDAGFELKSMTGTGFWDSPATAVLVK